MKEKLDSLSQEEQKLVDEARTIRTILFELNSTPCQDYYHVYAGREMGLIQLATEHPTILALQYHCAIALPSKLSLKTLFDNNLGIGGYILNDILLTEGQKTDLFLSYIEASLLNLNLARAHVTCQQIEATIFSIQALEKPAKELVHEVYYEAAVYYKDIKPRKAIECCIKINDYHPANHLLAQLVAKEECRIPEEQRLLFCLNLLKTASNQDGFQEVLCSILKRLDKFIEGENLDSLINSALDQKEWAVALAEKRLFFWLNDDQLKLLGVKHSMFFSVFNTYPADIQTHVAVTSLNLSLI